MLCKCPKCEYEFDVSIPSRIFCHHFTTGLFSSLWRAYIWVKNNNKNCFHPVHDLNLDTSQYNNFQKLRYFALIAQVKGQSGKWLITTMGGRFLRGEIVIQDRKWTRDNHIVDNQSGRHGLVHLDEMKRKSNEGIVFQEMFGFDLEKLERPQQELDLPPIKSKLDLTNPKTIARMCQ